MFGLGTGEIILIILALLLLFGAKKIPELARGIGKSLSEFKKGSKDVESDVKSDVKSEAEEEEEKKIENKKL